jgi:hypothetical protein
MRSSKREALSTKTARSRQSQSLNTQHLHSLRFSNTSLFDHFARAECLVATQNGMIPPPAQRMMAERAGATVREEAGSHAIYVSKPQPVADIIEAAAG